MAANCPNCGIELSETPEEDGLHPVHHPEYAEDGEEYCSACAFRAPDHGTYKNPGNVISRAAELNATDEELVEALLDAMTVPELRRFMSAFDMSRTRGANKRESAEQAVEQNRDRVAYQVRNTVDEEPAFIVECSSCGFEEPMGGPDNAVELAREHKSENPTHFPTATEVVTGERVYG